MHFIREKRFVKLVSITAFIFALLILLIIEKIPPATGYEVSIYTVYPQCFWVFVGLTLISGIYILSLKYFAKEKSNLWILGLFIILLTNFIILLLPEFRGYVFYGRGDTATHLGFIRDILEMSYIGKSNFYPIVHLLGAELIHVMELKLVDAPSLLTILSYAVYLVGVGLLARYISCKGDQFIFIVAFSLPFIYSFLNIGIRPNIFSLFLIPYILYFFHRRNTGIGTEMEDTIALILLSFLIVFTHAVTTILIIVVLLTFRLSSPLYKKILKKREFNNNEVKYLIKERFRVTGLVLIMFITFFMWYSSFAFINQSFKKIAFWFLGQIGKKSLIEAQITPLAKASLTLFQVIELFIYRYGAISILLSISFIASIFIIHKILIKKGKVEPMVFIYSIQFLVSLFIGLTMLFGYFIEYNPIRVFRLSILMGTILSGLVIFDFVTYMRDRHQKLAHIVFIGLIMVVISLSITNIYHSPLTFRPNQQISQAEISGIGWFEHFEKYSVPVVLNIDERLNRFENYLFGFENTKIAKVQKAPERLPSHFGYDENNSVAKTFDFQSRYILFFEMDKKVPMTFPENVRPKIYQWREKDFIKLKNDLASAHIYTNSGMRVWLISERE